MKNIFIPSNCEQITKSDDESAYIISSNDKFIKAICDIYNIKLCLAIQDECTNGHYMCLYRHNNYVKKILTLPFSTSLFFRIVAFKNDSTNQFIPMYSDFLNKYDSFRMNVDECVISLKEKIVSALGSGFNKLSDYCKDEIFGTLPCGSSENEIMMKMKLMGFK